jgi:Eukaryotic aspartyl protease
VLLSSSGSSLWVPLLEGCIDTDPLDCPDQRGGLYNYNSSSTWKADDLYELPLQAESSLGYSGNSLVGFDNITLGWTGSGGLSINNTVVTGVATKDFFLGQLGLTSRPVNISDFNHQYSSPLGSLFEDKKIPSLTWSYTAGAPYRQQKAHGSLTMGGYDAARSDIAHGLAVNMGVENIRDLLLAITNITSDGEPLLKTGIYAFIDSTIPHIWLPLDVCARFEEVFGLVFDNVTDLYLVNNTLHDHLLRSNPNVTISLASSVSGEVPAEASSNSSAIDIILPYGAFDMEATYPLASSTDINATSRYFPLRRAFNSSQYTLGRTFLQEAYLHVDYGRSTFIISQTKFPSAPADPGNIIPVYPEAAGEKDSEPPNQGNESSQPDQKRKNGMIAGITIGVVLLAAGLIAAVVFHRRYRRRRATTLASQSNLRNKYMVAENDSEEPKAELAGDAGKEGKWQVRAKHFLDGREIHQARQHRGSGTSPTGPVLSGGPTPAWELSSGESTPRPELDAMNREIFELPAEVAEEVP